MQRLELDYINGYAANQYAFLPMPYMLIDHPAYKELGAGEKILYTLMLNRLSLSGRNTDKYTDNVGRLYIIYTVEQVQKSMACSKPTAIKYLQNLTEIGLIERVRQGQGKPTITYVKDFATVQACYIHDAHSKKNQKSKSFTSGSQIPLLQEVKEFDPSNKDLSQLDDSPSLSGKDTLFGKRKNILLTKTEYEGLMEDYGTRLVGLLDECSDRIFARAPGSEPIKNYYRYIQTIARTLGYKTNEHLRAEQEQAEAMKKQEQAEDARRLQELMKEYGAKDEAELDEMMKKENREQIEKLMDRLKGAL